MGKRWTSFMAGGALVCVFFAWVVVKGTDTVRGWTDAAPVLGFVGWGFAWLTITAGAALISKGMRNKLTAEASTGTTDKA